MDVVQYKCPNCGAEMNFSPETQRFDCEYCLSSFTQPEIDKIAHAEQELSEEDKQKNKEYDEGVSLYMCPSCGAEILADDTTSATFCYYCHAPVILKGRLQGEFRPTKVIPFKYTREKMLEIYKKWCHSKWFIPRDYTSTSQMDKISGIYIPYWLTDCDVDADATAFCKDVTTETRGEYRYTTTKEYNVVRKGTFSFNQIPADGSSKADDKLMQALEPYDYSKMEPFSMSYLSGYLSEKYDVPKEKIFPIVSDRITKCAMQTVRKSIKHNSVTFTSQNYRIKNVKTDYVLMPVWFMTYRYNGKYYYFAMNGQTGRIAGLPPLDKMKVFLTCLAITGGTTLITLLALITGIL